MKKGKNPKIGCEQKISKVTKKRKEWIKNKERFVLLRKLYNLKPEV